MSILNYSRCLGALLLVCGTARAEGLPKPVADLERWVGTWKGPGSMRTGKDSAQVEATWTCQRTSASFGVACTLRVTGIPGLPSYEETDLMGYEPGTNTYHWYSVTNAGETHDHVARAIPGNSLHFVFTGNTQGKPLEEVIDLTFSPDQRRVLGKAETRVDGRAASVLELSLGK
jgi:hypothetical protein